MPGTRHRATKATLLALTLLVTASAFAQTGKTATKMSATAKPRAKMVAYDAKDKRYYSVAYAWAHGMHDKGGDHLIVVPRSSLPKEAKLSHAMKGIEP